MNEHQTQSFQAHSLAEVATPHAGRYLTQLCKHFQHKLPVTFDERSGHIVFSMGDCRLEAGEGALRLAAAAPDDAQLGRLEDVVARHLLRFAFREEIRVDWRRA
jgi:hypothetical protein